jgi:hypothetical protein
MCAAKPVIPKHVLHTAGQPPIYYECSECGFLTAEKAATEAAKPCPQCTLVPVSWRLFPDERLRRLEQRIQRYHADGDDEIVVILVATQLEALLEDTLARMLAAHGADVAVQEVLLDSMRSIGQRLSRLFPALTGEQFEDVAAELCCQDFPKRWRALRELRNSFIHDAPFVPSPDVLDHRDAEEAMALLDQAYRLFVLINDRFATGAPVRSHYEPS